MASLTVATNRAAFNLNRPMNRFCATGEFALPTSGTRIASHTVPVTAGNSLARRCSCGAASLKAANRFLDRKSTRLNSSHPSISYAVFCLKKKKKKNKYTLNKTKKNKNHKKQKTKNRK